MEKIDVSNPAWWLALALVVLGYMLIDAHKSIKASIREKADKTYMDAMEVRHANEMARIERQYAEWRESIVQQFSERMNSMESNLTNRIDMVLKIVERRHEP